MGKWHPALVAGAAGVLLVLAAAVFAVIRWLVQRARRLRAQRELEYTTRMGVVREALSGKKVIVAMRNKAQKRTDFETQVIQQLVHLGVHVEEITSAVRDKVRDGEIKVLSDDYLALVGVYERYTVFSNYIRHTLDARLVTSEGRIIGAVVGEGDDLPSLITYALVDLCTDIAAKD